MSSALTSSRCGCQRTMCTFRGLRAAPKRRADPEAGPDGPLPSDAIMAMLDRTNDSRALLGFPRLPMTLMHYLTSCPRLRLADLLDAAATSSDSTAKSIAAAVVAPY